MPRNKGPRSLLTSEELGRSRRSTFAYAANERDEISRALPENHEAALRAHILKGYLPHHHSVIEPTLPTRASALDDIERLGAKFVADRALPLFPSFKDQKALWKRVESASRNLALVIDEIEEKLSPIARVKVDFGEATEFDFRAMLDLVNKQAAEQRSKPVRTSFSKKSGKHDPVRDRYIFALCRLWKTMGGYLSPGHDADAAGPLLRFLGVATPSPFQAMSEEPPTMESLREVVRKLRKHNFVWLL